MFGLFKKNSDYAPVSKGQFFDFPGGIHPPENKKQSSEIAIRELPLPEILVLPLGMHIGAPAKPLVKEGDAVIKGQRIANAQGFISAHVHAPASGVVQAIELRPIAHQSGLSDLCIVLETNGNTETDCMPVIDEPLSAEPQALVDRIFDAGINGLGGAGFPTNVKVSAKQKINTFILNAVECEPYITADDRLMRERSESIITGIQIIQHILWPKESALANTKIGIEDNKPAAIKVVRDMIAEKGLTDSIDVVVVPTKYPSGGEKQLIQNITNIEVPKGKIPADIGVLCMNIGTVYAVQRAVCVGEPLISRITTLTGDAISDKGNVEVLIGTPIKHVLAAANASETQMSRLVMGGPMMGFTLKSSDVPVVKTTNCIIAGSAQEFPESPQEQSCIRCGECAEACPASLQPQQLYWHSKHREFEKAEALNLMDCIECGACAFVCPSHIPLVQYYRYGKGEVRLAQAEAVKADKARERFEFRQERLDKEQAEKEARRKARLEKSKQKKAAGGANTAQDDKVKALKKEMLAASQEYKNSVKAFKAAEAEGAGDVEDKRLAMESAKAKAASAKEAVRQANAGERVNEMTELEKKQKQLVDFAVSNKALSQAIKALEDGDEKAAKEAELAKLQEEMLALKAEVKALKSQEKAKAEKEAGAAKVDDGSATLEADLKQSKADAAKAQKVFKEAKKALEQASKAGSDNLDVLGQQVEKLKANADTELAQMMDLQKQVKAQKAAPNLEADLKQAKADAAESQKAFKEAKKALAETDGADSEKLAALKTKADADLARMMDLQKQSKALKKAQEEGKS